MEADGKVHRKSWFAHRKVCYRTEILALCTKMMDCRTEDTEFDLLNKYI